MNGKLHAAYSCGNAQRRLLTRRTQAFDVAGQHVDFEINLSPDAQRMQVGCVERMRNEVYFENGVVHGIHSKTYAADCDRALARYVAPEIERRPHRQPAIVTSRFELEHRADSVNMAAHKMPA